MRTVITMEQALIEDEFHYQALAHGKCYRWRRNGATKTWKTRPGEFRIPVKYGLYGYGYITEFDHGYHVASECEGMA